jgi:hypothetical protein
MARYRRKSASGNRAVLSMSSICRRCARFCGRVQVILIGSFH